MLSVNGNCSPLAFSNDIGSRCQKLEDEMQLSDDNEVFVSHKNSEVAAKFSAKELNNNNNASSKPRTSYSRKREASSSLSEEPKRRDQLRDSNRNVDFFSSESMELLIQQNVNDNQSVLSKENRNRVCHNAFPDINMNDPVKTNGDQPQLYLKCHVDVISIPSFTPSFTPLPKDNHAAENGLGVYKSNKNLSLENCSISSSTSDLSTNSTGTSVGIQEDLDCLHLTDGISNSSDSSNEVSASPLVPSLFHRVPPTIYFGCSDEKVYPLPLEVRQLLKWKLSTITPVLIRQTVERSGFQLTKDNTDWIGTWGKHMKCVAFNSLKDYQKVNHFPGSFHLGRKDKMSQIYKKMVARHSTEEFSFFPETFVLPQDIRQLRHVWENEGARKRWIIKPPASARGTGIKVINKWTQIPKKRPVIVQRYLSEPYLINGAKFDLRLYVLVPNYDPLKVYIYDDGLVRFASVKYSTSAHSLNDPFMHLTNYSINRKNSAYTANDSDSSCQGHKWSLKSLWNYLAEKRIDTNRIWEEIVDLVIKTVICSEGPMTRLIRNYSKNRYNCFELFGFDIMLDKNLKPWLLEVNISPSLHTSSSLDFKVKGSLTKDMLNIVGFQIPDKVLQNICPETMYSKYGITAEETQNLCINKSLHQWYLSPDEKAKHSNHVWKGTVQNMDVLDNLTPDDVRQLIESEGELHRSGSYIRIFPSSTSSKYLKYFEYSRYYNILLDAWEQKYRDNRSEGISLLQSLCQKNVHLQTVFKDSPFPD